MKVLEVGVVPSKKLVCHRCGSVLEYNNEDIQRLKHTDYLGDTDYTDVIICPICGATNEPNNDGFYFRVR